MESQVHHAAPAHEVLVLVGSDPEHGLTSKEARRRLERLGPNMLPPRQRQSALVRFLLQFHHPLIYVLIVAGVAALALRETVDAFVIFAVVVINAVIGFVQEHKAQAALDALAQLVETRATVIRDGEASDVPSEELVPGDVVLLAAGDRVPADLRLIQVDELEVDESALTGESVPVGKTPPELPTRTTLADRTNMSWSGTLVTRGAARGVVVAHGADTELGHVQRLMEAADDLTTPLTKELAKFSKLLTYVILGVAAVTFGIGMLRGEAAGDMVTAAVALAVAMIPEGLPAVVTITLAVGVTRMARRNAIIRKLPAVETLGSTTVICSDKTGTLTENRQQVLRLVTHDTETSPKDMPGVDSGLDATVRQLLLTGLLCNDARPDPEGGYLGDPTEAALLEAASRVGIDVVAERRAHPRVATLPFSSSRRLMASRHTPEDQGSQVHLKGAAEAVLARCRTVRGASGDRSVDVEAWAAAVHDLAGHGLRVLACAVADDSGSADSLTEEELDQLDFVLLGVQAMADPPREAAVRAVAVCQQAGIEVKMITGDHAGTARAIGTQVGLAPRGGEVVVVTGSELEEASDEELADLAERAEVFARVSPEDKLRLVRALQSRHHIVAMTGDGVNDAPALEQADIGVAMGKVGTEVAQEAADMVLTDDNFASIEAAVEEGRGVFDNLIKFLTFILPTNIGQGLVILTGIFLGTALPITPVQILWVNLTTAVFLGLPLAVELKEPGIMTRPPRDAKGPLLARRHVVRMLIVSVFLLAGAFGLFELLLANGADIAEARTAAVNLFMIVESGYLLTCRSFDRSLGEIGFWSNKWVLAGIAAAISFQVLFTYAPFMNTLFDTAPLGVMPWLAAFGYAVLAYVVLDLLRLFERRRRHR